LPLLHRFSLAYALRHSSGDDMEYSLVPCMLPAGPEGDVTVDGAIGRVAHFEREVGVEYQLGYLPPDLWPHLILRCSAMVIPEACTRSTAVLQHRGQRALVALQSDGESLRLIARGSDPEELRVRFHWTLLGLCADKFPFLRIDGSVHAVCHVCHGASRVVVGRSSDTSFHCGHCVRPRVTLPVTELDRTPSAALDAALTTKVLNLSGVEALCRVAAWRVDTTSFFLDSQGHRCPLWLPLYDMDAGAGAGTGAVDTGGPGGPVWVRVCEDPSGWHLLTDNKVSPPAELPKRTLRALSPLLQQLATVICTISPIMIGWAGPLATRDSLRALVSVEPLSSSCSEVDRAAWVAWTRSLGEIESRSHMFCDCSEHGNSHLAEESRVRAQGLQDLV
jgi:hypothetical protein